MKSAAVLGKKTMPLHKAKKAQAVRDEWSYLSRAVDKAHLNGDFSVTLDSPRLLEESAVKLRDLGYSITMSLDGMVVVGWYPQEGS